MTVRTVRIDELPVERWANGLGRTRPVLEEDGLRVSVATIHEAAPFSPLPGLHRLLTVVGPVGVRLTVDGAGREVEPGEAIRFSGAAAVSVDATAEPTAVLNILHDERWGADVLIGPVPPDEPADLRTALDCSGAGVIAISGRRLTLAITGPTQSSAGATRVILASWAPVPGRSR
ncbi:hypothetical protein GRS96_04630 [Rathayibacter sp. VKM Ac-2803]|uniref:HutD family protein n=1 Tax=unclassified Rathayibacter TaxID=2609250 RepID=UPI001358CCDA|nr:MULTISPECIES: HutD family protein [unclassified Rathayibacter]MWV48562.1 hypothetical protein [Rathayibacter sp. VKM Ac-2803]MWV60100.1 hypothetical protein [Rathayibacter sp. VKM Ac-2754]